MLAIIGGSGLSRLVILDDVERKVVRTSYGEPSGALSFGRIGQAHRPLVQHAAAIRSQRSLRQLGDLSRQKARRRKCAARLDDPFDQPDGKGLGCPHGPAGQDQVERPTLADQARKADRAHVDQRHAKSAVEDTKRRVARSNA